MKYIKKQSVSAQLLSLSNVLPQRFIIGLKDGKSLSKEKVSFGPPTFECSRYSALLKACTECRETITYGS